jgi:hypothetical protein
MITISRKHQLLGPAFDERARRLWAAVEAKSLGWGGISLVSQASGIARSTILRGIHELDQIALKDDASSTDRIRQLGAGRKSVTVSNPHIIEAMEKLIEPTTRGDPESPLRWTCKSLRKLAEELTLQGYPVGLTTVRRLLHGQGYSLQANRKTREGINHPDRNLQFEYINEKVKTFHRAKQPVISVDTKKKELLGDFSNVGREYGKKGQPVETRTHDFPDKQLGKAIPYGVFDVYSNEGWVNIGINHDTARFAANSILRWWQEMGQSRFPKATRLLITADSGGSNASRSRHWKIALQDLSNQLHINVTVCHLPPGTSKWNKIEHRLFSFITKNWRGKPLYDLQTIVNLISHTTTRSGLIVKSAIDNNYYETGIKISDADLASVKIQRHSFHGEWNYTIQHMRTKI